MNILVACEESGTVTTEFRKRGHEAWSCDILPTRGNPVFHFQKDVRTLLFQKEWDMILTFPPCDHLAVSGARYFAEKRADGRQQEGVDFFMMFVRHAVKYPNVRMCIENPVGIMSTVYRRPDQIIQPYRFGHDASKKTCLWLFNLPLLVPTGCIPPNHYGRWGNQTPSGQNRRGPSKHRKRDRSQTYFGIAKAMAEQWGKLPTLNQ